MMYLVIEEIWSISPNSEERKLLRSFGPLFVGDRTAADESARKRAREFVDHYDFQRDANPPYWWGRKRDERENHRLIVMAVHERGPNHRNVPRKSEPPNASGSSTSKTVRYVLVREPKKQKRSGRMTVA
jgi:hypothetical protein